VSGVSARMLLGRHEKTACSPWNLGFTKLRPDRRSNPRLPDRKSDALPLRHYATHRCRLQQLLTNICRQTGVFRLPRYYGLNPSTAIRMRGVCSFVSEYL